MNKTLLSTTIKTAIAATLPLLVAQTLDLNSHLQHSRVFKIEDEARNYVDVLLWLILRV